MSEVRRGRREIVGSLVRGAGLAPAVLGFLEGRVLALPRGQETDLAVLDGALALEHEAIAIYDLGLREKLFPAPLRERAIEFRGDHIGHRDTQVALMKERGGRPCEPLSEYAWPHVGPGDDMVRLALEIEAAAQQAYTALLSQIGSDDYLLSAGFILIDEVRHLTVWKRVLSLRIY